MALATLIGGATLSPPSAHAQLRAQVVGEQYIPLRIAVPDFDAAGPGAAEIAQQLTGVIRADLTSSAPFRVLEPSSFIERDLDITKAPLFGNWTVSGLEAQALVVGNVVVDAGTNQMTVQYRLWDVYGQNQQFAMSYAVPTPLNWRRLAHKVADDIFLQLTGDPGYFDSRVVFVSKTPGDEPYRGRLAIMDQDGANAEFLLSGFTSVINPRFSPTEQVILYGAYIQDPRYPTATLLRTYLYDIATGRQEILAEGQGQLDFSARFSPDGRSIVFSRAQGGNTDIYMIDLATRKQTRMTNDSAIETSPSFSPDGKMIVYQSDRGSSKQLYIMNADRSPMVCPRGGGAQSRFLPYNVRRGRLQLYRPGLVAPRRLDRLLASGRRSVRDRRPAEGWIRPAHPHGWLSGRKPDLVAQWTGYRLREDGFARCRTQDLLDRSDGTQRAPDADAAGMQPTRPGVPCLKWSSSAANRVN